MSGIQLVIFTLVVGGLSLGLNLYLARRLMTGLGLSQLGRRIGVALAIANAIAIPGLFRLIPYSGQPWADTLQAIGWVSVGLFGLLLIFMLVKDVLWWGSLKILDKADSDLAPDPARREALTLMLNGGVAAASLGVGGVAYQRAKSTAIVKRVSIPIDGLAEGLRGLTIAQISDIHVGPTVRGPQMQAIVDAVNTLGPDLIAVTGDLVDGSVEGLREMVAPLGQLAAPLGTYFITGNHEYYSGAEDWCAHCEGELGWRVLLNQSETIERGGATLAVAGVTDRSAGRFSDAHAPDLKAAMAGTEGADLRLLLAHQPVIATEAAEAGADLQLSGHTHGGQFFPFTLLIHLAQRFVIGLHRVGEMWLYVNPGTTYWGPPMRLGADHEITLIELTRA